jgi:peptidoglycan/xylan/chitin deacetylase (PgdA/CDA1 family)
MWAQAFETIGWNARAHRRLDGSRAAVLMYHRVLPEAEAQRLAVEPGMYVTPETFARHCAWLAEDFRVLPLHEAVERLVARRPLPPGACAITFDDGWRDNHDHALPELRLRNLPATVFVVTDRVGTEGAFWPDEVCLRMASLGPSERRRLAAALGAQPAGDPVTAVLVHLKGLSDGDRWKALDRLVAGWDRPEPRERLLLHWDELERMTRQGVDVESHGATHASLPGLGVKDLERELASAREKLLERGHGRHGLVAYPFGAWDRRIADAAARVGYRAGFTGARGLASSSEDAMALPRLPLHEDVSRTRVEFRLRISGAG